MGYFAVILIICGFLGDFFNNSKALTGGLDFIGVNDLGLIMIAFAIAGSITALGYAATAIHKGFWVGAVLMLACSASLTLYAQWSDVEARDIAKDNQSALLPSLMAEKETLLNSLNGTPPCADQRWCNSQAKEARVAEINRQVSEMRPESGNPGGPWLAYALLFAVSIGAPIGNLFCSAMASKLLKRKKETVQSNVVEFKKKLLDKLTAQSKNRTTDRTTPPLYSLEGGKSKVVQDDQYSKAKEAVSRLYSKGERPSVRKVMDVREGGKRVAPGRSDEIAGHLRQMHEEGLLIKKGQGYWYADHYGHGEEGVTRKQAGMEEGG